MLGSDIAGWQMWECVLAEDGRYNLERRLPWDVVFTPGLESGNRIKQGVRAP